MVKGSKSEPNQIYAEHNSHGGTNVRRFKEPPYGKETLTYGFQFAPRSLTPPEARTVQSPIQ